VHGAIRLATQIASRQHEGCDLEQRHDDKNVAGPLSGLFVVDHRLAGSGDTFDHVVRVES